MPKACQEFLVLPNKLTVVTANTIPFVAKEVLLMNVASVDTEALVEVKSVQYYNPAGVVPSFCGFKCRAKDGCKQGSWGDVTLEADNYALAEDFSNSNVRTAPMKGKGGVSLQAACAWNADGGFDKTGAHQPGNAMLLTPDTVDGVDEDDAESLARGNEAGCYTSGPFTGMPFFCIEQCEHVTARKLDASSGGRRCANGDEGKEGLDDQGKTVNANGQATNGDYTQCKKPCWKQCAEESDCPGERNGNAWKCKPGFEELEKDKSRCRKCKFWYKSTAAHGLGADHVCTDTRKCTTSPRSTCRRAAPAATTAPATTA